MKQQDWTQQLHERLSDYQTAVPDGLWDDIERQLVQRAKARTVALRRRWLGAAAAVALLAGIGWWQWPQAEQPAPQSEGQPTASLTAPDTTSVTIGTAAVTVGTTSVTVGTTSVTAPNAAPLLTAQHQKRRHTQSNNTPDAVPTPPTSERATVDTTSVVSPTTPPARHTTPASQPSPTPARKQEHAVSVALHASNGLLAYHTANGVQMSNERASQYDAAANALTTRAPIYLTGYEEHQHYDHPVSLGLSVGFSLTSRWALQTGVVYTRLRAEFTSVMPTARITREQTLHYVGIPLGVQYMLWSTRQLKTYATAGIEADWNVAARQETAGVETPMQKDRWQWSAGGAVGVEYLPVPQLGIYVEPGLRYYPDNGSAVQNYFKDHPTAWSLQLGIRMNLGR